MKYLIAGHKKHRESSLEPENHEKQLFISVWDREVGQIRCFCLKSDPKSNWTPLSPSGEFSCFGSRFRTKTSDFSNFPFSDAPKKLVFVVFRFQRTFPVFFMNYNQLFGVETSKYPKFRSGGHSLHIITMILHICYNFRRMGS